MLSWLPSHAALSTPLVLLLVAPAPRAQGTAPRAQDTAPRAEDTAPRAQDTAPRAEDTAPTIAGSWSGRIVVPGAELEIAVRIDRVGEGGWTGAVDIPVQGAEGLALEGFEVDGAHARFRIADAPGEPTFDGTLASDGRTLAGPFLQFGQQFRFELERADPGAALAAAREALAGLEEFVAEALAALETPAAGVAVVLGGEVVLARGFGLRDVEAQLPATEHTLFAIGSTTKAFTAALLADLVEEGLLDWDAPVQRMLPGFELQDEYATAHATVVDLLTHRAGLPRHDLAWYGADATRAELLARLRFLEPSAELRAEWQYQNLMYVAAGALAGELSGATWEEALRARLLEPLGWERSVLSISDMQASDDFAWPYEERDGALERVPFRDLDAVGPAGSIDSSAAEMARWVAMLLEEGELDGERVLASESVEALFEPRMVVPGAPAEPEDGRTTYALGWMVQPWRGRERLHHGGGIDGFTALVTLFPRDELGLVVLCNRGGSALPGALTAWIADRVLGLEPIDWLARRKTAGDVVRAAVDVAVRGRGARERVADTRPSHALADYAGEYGHPGYGVAYVTLDGEALRVALNGIEAPLEHWHYDVFQVEDGVAEGAQVQFHTDLAGTVGALSSVLEPRVAAIRFERRPPAELSDPAFQERVVGRYALPGAVATVARRGGRLTVRVPGQPTYALVPLREREYALEGLEGYSMRVTIEDGRCTRVAFVQPDGTFPAERVDD